jgi:hypothetical protein
VGCVEHAFNGLAEVGDRGTLGRQVDGRTGPRRARGDLDLVLGLSGEDHRHAVLQRLLNPTVTAVADQNARAGQQFGEGDELGDPRRVACWDRTTVIMPSPEPGIWRQARSSALCG